MLAIAGGKGGCGKTTTACAIAGTLAAWGQAPVVVDADVAMPDLARRVQAGHGPGIDALAAGRPVGSVVQTDHELSGVGVVASGAPGSLDPALQALRTVTGPILVDCPGGAGPDVAAPLSACDRALVVSTDTRASLEDATKTAAMARELDARVAGLALRETDCTGVGVAGGADRVRRRLDVPWVVTVGRLPDPDTGDPPSAARLARALFDPPGSGHGGDGPSATTRTRGGPPGAGIRQRRHRHERDPSTRSPGGRNRRPPAPD